MVSFTTAELSDIRIALQDRSGRLLARCNGDTDPLLVEAKRLAKIVEQITEDEEFGPVWIKRENPIPFNPDGMTVRQIKNVAEMCRTLIDGLNRSSNLDNAIHFLGGAVDQMNKEAKR